MSVEENKAVTRRYFDEFHNQRNMAVAAEIAPAASAEGIQRLATMMRTAFPDYQVQIQHMVAEADKVATVWQGQGTHQGDWPSPIGIIPATGRSVTWTGTTTLRIEDGKIVETLGSNWDHLGILQQMGQVAESAPRSGA